MSDGELVQFMRQVMSELDQIDERKADIREIYANARSAGFDKAAMGAAIRDIRARAKLLTPSAQEKAVLVELYVSAYDSASRTCMHVPARAEIVPTYPERVSRPAINPPPGYSPEAQDEGTDCSSQDSGADASAAGVGGDFITAQSAQFVASPGAGEGVAAPDDPAPAANGFKPFLVKPHVLRPLCKNPSECAGYGSTHCGQCLRSTHEAAA